MKLNNIVSQIKITILFLLFSITSFAQSNEGYWDNIRTTNETITLKAGEKKLIKTANFPEGTTEIVYRITLLDDNQKLSSSLVSVLKVIPDPTGISQGAAGAVFLLSSISGSDKCKYTIFQQEKDAENFIETGKKNNACIDQNTPINKEAKLLSNDSKCGIQNSKNLFFTFESDNWIMNQKIVLEIVPWVNIKASLGWNIQSKNEIIAIAKSHEVAKLIAKKDQFYASFLESISKKYKYNEFKELLSVERVNAIEISIEEALKKTGEVEKLYQSIQSKAISIFNSGKTNDAIDYLKSEMFEKKRASAIDYGILGDFYLFSKQFTKAENAYNKSLELNPSEINFQLNLAHIYMFTERLSQSKEIHKKYVNQNLFTGKTWKEQVKIDFSQFEKKGFNTEDFNKILKIMK